MLIPNRVVIAADQRLDAFHEISNEDDGSLSGRHRHQRRHIWGRSKQYARYDEHQRRRQKVVDCPNPVSLAGHVNVGVTVVIIAGKKTPCECNQVVGSRDKAKDWDLRAMSAVRAWANGPRPTMYPTFAVPQSTCDDGPFHLHRPERGGPCSWFAAPSLR